MDNGGRIIGIADGLVKQIYKQTLNFSYKHQSSIGDQLRRSSLSIVLNIIEGGARRSVKERKHLNNIAFGSLKETKYLIHFCKEMVLIDGEFYSLIMGRIDELARILYSLVYK